MKKITTNGVMKHVLLLFVIILPALLLFAKENQIEADTSDKYAIPVLMFHKVVDEPEYPEDISPEQLRVLLDHIFSNGYYPINVSDLLLKRFDDIVPSGYMPIVITADDSHPSVIYSTSNHKHPNLKCKMSFIEIYEQVSAKYSIDPRMTIFLSHCIDDRTESGTSAGYFGGVESLADIIKRYSTFEGIEYGYHTVDIS